MMIGLYVAEYLVWLAHLRGGRRVRDVDSRLPALQAAHHDVSLLPYVVIQRVDRFPDPRPRLSYIRTAISPPSRSCVFDVLPLNQNQNKPPTLPCRPYLIPPISRS